MKIFLSYGIYTGGVIVWQEPPTDYDAVTIVPVPENKRTTGSDLRDIPYSHLHSARDSWELVISADELSESMKYNWLKQFFNADAWRYGTSDFYYGYGMGYGYVDVFLLNQGKMPVSFLEENMNLPEVVLNLQQKWPI